MSEKTQLKLIRRTTTVERLVVETTHTGEQMLALLNNGSAGVLDNEIAGEAQGDTEGWPVYGRVLNQTRETDAGKYAIDEPCHCCKPMTAEEQTRANAAALGNIAYRHIPLGNLKAAAFMLRAARLLFKQTGGFANEQGIRHLTLEAMLLETEGKKAKALPQVKQAYELSKQLLELTDPFLAVAHANYAEILLEVKDARKAEPLLAEANRLIQTSTPNGDWNQAAIDQQKHNIAALLHQAQAALPHSQAL